MPTTTYVCMPQRRCLGASYKAQNRVTQSTPGTRYYVVLMCSFWVSPESLCWDFGAPLQRGLASSTPFRATLGASCKAHSRV